MNYIELEALNFGRCKELRQAIIYTLDEPAKNVIRQYRNIHSVKRGKERTYLSINLGKRSQGSK